MKEYTQLFNKNFEDIIKIENTDFDKQWKKKTAIVPRLKNNKIEFIFLFPGIKPPTEIEKNRKIKPREYELTKVSFVVVS